MKTPEQKKDIIKNLEVENITSLEEKKITKSLEQIKKGEYTRVTNVKELDKFLNEL